MNALRSFVKGCVLVLPLLAAPSVGGAQEAQSLDELLDKVRAGWRAERAENQRRDLRTLSPEPHQHQRGHDRGTDAGHEQVASPNAEIGPEDREQGRRAGAPGAGAQFPPVADPSTGTETGFANAVFWRSPPLRARTTPPAQTGRSMRESM